MMFQSTKSIELSDAAKAIIDIAASLGISVHDHIIVCKSGHASLKGMRLI